MFGMMEALLSFIRRQVGLRTDQASATGSLHAKVGDVKVGINSLLAASNVKSVQRGTMTIAPQGTFATATISAVTTSKTIINPLGSTGDFRADDYFGVMFATKLVLASSTQIRVDRVGGTGASELIVGYEVIEFN